MKNNCIAKVTGNKSSVIINGELLPLGYFSSTEEAKNQATMTLGKQIRWEKSGEGFEGYEVNRGVI